MLGLEVELQRDLVVPSTLTDVICVRPGRSGRIASPAVRDGGGHRLRARAGILRGHRHRRELHVRQWRHRQQRIGGEAGEEYRRGQQRRRDRPPDERGGDAHRAVRSLALRRLNVGLRLIIRGHLTGRRARACGDLHAWCQPRLAGHDDCLAAGEPLGDHGIAAVLVADLDCDGRHGLVRLDSVDEQPVGPMLHRQLAARERVVQASTCTRVLTNSPGHSWLSALSNVAFNAMVPVVVSIVLFGVSSVPCATSSRVLAVGRLDRHRALCACGLYLRQIGLRQGEHHRDWLVLGDRHDPQTGLAGHLDEVAGIDLVQADAPVDRRVDDAIVRD